jgi:hypothetical protein
VKGKHLQFRSGSRTSSFGTVWKIEPKACPPNSGVAFAAKHIAINADADTHEVENEINILKGCKSPYIVSYYGVFRQETLLWVFQIPPDNAHSFFRSSWITAN